MSIINTTAINTEVINGLADSSVFESAVVITFRQNVQSLAPAKNAIILRQVVELNATFSGDANVITLRQVVNHHTPAHNAIILRQRVYDD